MLQNLNLTTRCSWVTYAELSSFGGGGSYASTRDTVNVLQAPPREYPYKIVFLFCLCVGGRFFVLFCFSFCFRLLQSLFYLFLSPDLYQKVLAIASFIFSQESVTFGNDKECLNWIFLLFNSPKTVRVIRSCVMSKEISKRLTVKSSGSCSSFTTRNWCLFLNIAKIELTTLNEQISTFMPLSHVLKMSALERRNRNNYLNPIWSFSKIRFEKWPNRIEKYINIFFFSGVSL